jgi:type 1 glutamine amidotransferase
MRKTIFRTALLSFLMVVCFAASYSQQFKVLLFTKTEGFHHESVHEGVTALRQLASRNNFTVDWQDNGSIFNEKALANYAAVIFLNTTGNVLNDEQQAAFEKFIQSGKGFVGIHSATDTEYDWPWYTKMVGMMFKIHPQQQTAYLKVEDSNFPGMERFPKKLLWTDEWYEYGDRKATDLHFLLSVDEKSYDPNVKWGENVGKGMGSFHPIAWYHNYDGGRAFYTGLGHIALIYTDQTFLDHLYGGIYWAATGKGM